MGSFSFRFETDYYCNYTRGRVYANRTRTHELVRGNSEIFYKTNYYRHTTRRTVLNKRVKKTCARCIQNRSDRVRRVASMQIAYARAYRKTGEKTWIVFDTLVRASLKNCTCNRNVFRKRQQSSPFISTRTTIPGHCSREPRTPPRSTSQHRNTRLCSFCSCAT